jgi:catechol 2,3-dioxygenase-like lactoylglutathione lyase family enzyme
MVIDALIPLLSVADVGRSIAFYTTVLPFRVAEETAVDGETRWALLRCGSAALMIGRSDRPGDGGMALHLYVEDVRACREALLAKGVGATEIQPTPYGAEAFHLRDPDGHTLTIASRPMRIA